MKINNTHLGPNDARRVDWAFSHHHYPPLLFPSHIFTLEPKYRIKTLVIIKKKHKEKK
jgi:hypothetical protein